MKPSVGVQDTRGRGLFFHRSDPLLLCGEFMGRLPHILGKCVFGIWEEMLLLSFSISGFKHGRNKPHCGS